MTNFQKPGKLIYRVLKRFSFFRELLNPENERLKRLPRFTATETIFLGKKISVPDAASFLFIKGELFSQEIYQFNTENPEPFIIDGGANIGLSIIYLKERFPNAIIVGFEPDEGIFKVLEHNVKAFEYNNVTLINKACWYEETTLHFSGDGADGGRVAKDFDTNNLVEIKTARLRNYLNQKVDFLKLDIEGAENEVLPDIQDLLGNVDKIFVEYHSFCGQEQRLPEILAILKKAGFRVIIHHIGIYSPQPFMEVLSYCNMDLQLNIFGYRL